MKRIHFFTFFIILIFGSPLIPLKSQNDQFLLKYSLDVVSINTFDDVFDLDDSIKGEVIIKEQVIGNINVYNIKFFIEGFFDLDVIFHKKGQFVVNSSNNNEENYYLPFLIPSDKLIVGNNVRVEGNNSFNINGKIEETSPIEHFKFGFQDSIHLFVDNNDVSTLKSKENGTIYFRPNAFFDISSGVLMKGDVFSMAIFYFITDALISGTITLDESSIDLGPESKDKAKIKISEFFPFLIPLFLTAIVVFAFKLTRRYQRIKRKKGSKLDNQSGLRRSKKYRNRRKE